jgi:hypothetical protein
VCRGDGLALKKESFPFFGYFLLLLPAIFRRHHEIYGAMNTRTLTIESSGDFWRGNIKPKIRLTGRWLEIAGFKPGHRVVVEIGEPRTLTLRFLEQGTPIHRES